MKYFNLFLEALLLSKFINAEVWMQLHSFKCGFLGSGVELIYVIDKNATNQMHTLDLDHLQFRAAESSFSKKNCKEMYLN